jgi:IstB-like ATP binding protein
MLFFQLMTRRYEQAPTVLRSNKGFKEWGEMFGDDVLAASLIDRLVHHCHIVTIRGNSYRMRRCVPMTRLRTDERRGRRSCGLGATPRSYARSTRFAA